MSFDTLDDDIDADNVTSYKNNIDKNCIDQITNVNLHCDKVVNCNVNVGLDCTNLELTCFEKSINCKSNKRQKYINDSKNSTNYIQDDVITFLTEVSGVNQESHHGIKRKSKKCKLPQWDSQIQAEWCQKSMSSIETLSYTISVFNDLLYPELARCCHSLALNLTLTVI